MVELKRFTLFLLTSGFAALVNIGARYLFNFVLSYELSIALAYICGMTTAFILAKLFVFHTYIGSSHKAYARFALINALAFAQVLIVTLIANNVIFPLFHWTWHAKDLAHILGVMSPTLTSYFGHKYFSFSSEQK